MNFIKRMLIAVFVTYIYMYLSVPLTASAHNALIIAANTNQHVNMAPFYWMVGIVGGTIAITLTYVSWRKYKGEKKKKTEDESNN